MIIDVTCAIIEDKGKILVAQRKKDSGYSLLYEFPGGKINPGETEQECIQREIFEELRLHIAVHQPLTVVVHVENGRVIRLIPFICSVTDGNLEVLEHEQVLWVYPEKLTSLDWCPADIPIMKEYLDVRNFITTATLKMV